MGGHHQRNEDFSLVDDCHDGLGGVERNPSIVRALLATVQPPADACHSS
jgi:hypothetical protein